MDNSLILQNQLHMNYIDKLVNKLDIFHACQNIPVWFSIDHKESLQLQFINDNKRVVCVFETKSSFFYLKHWIVGQNDYNMSSQKPFSVTYQQRYKKKPTRQFSLNIKKRYRSIIFAYVWSYLYEQKKHQHFSKNIQKKSL